MGTLQMKGYVVALAPYLFRTIDQLSTQSGKGISAEKPLPQNGFEFGDHNAKSGICKPINDL